MCLHSVVVKSALQRGKFSLKENGGDGQLLY
jgi:hypothetical protein